MVLGDREVEGWAGGLGTYKVFPFQSFYLFSQPESDMKMVHMSLGNAPVAMTALMLHGWGGQL